MPGDSDLAQAAVFIAVLLDEITATSTRVEESERRTQAEREAGHTTARLWHQEEARSQRKILYELHRQLDALNGRFPDAAGTARIPRAAPTRKG